MLEGEGSALKARLTEILSAGLDPNDELDERGILGHREAWQRRLGEGVDLRAAMLSYFVRVNPRLHNPKIVELALFDRTVSSCYRDMLTGLAHQRVVRQTMHKEGYTPDPALVNPSGEVFSTILPPARAATATTARSEPP